FIYVHLSRSHLSLRPLVLRLVKRLCDHSVSQVMCGNQHCIALSRDGQLFTWGQNTNGQLGLGKGEPSKLSPHPLKSLAGIPLAQITAGGDHSFALSLSGAVFGWGKNRAGQLGLNDKQGNYQLVANNLASYP
ncbi:putative E3 ubiquitin-protein ligase herc3, partial [Xenoophorus captivus]